MKLTMRMLMITTNCSNMNVSMVCILGLPTLRFAAPAAIDSMASVICRSKHCSGNYLLNFWSCRRLYGNNIDVTVIPALFHKAQMPLKCDNLFALQPSQCVLKSNLVLLLDALERDNGQAATVEVLRLKVKQHLEACLKSCSFTARQSGAHDKQTMKSCCVLPNLILLYIHNTAWLNVGNRRVWEGGGIV